MDSGCGVALAVEREDLTGEVWLPVVGYEGLYEVSNRGRVWSVPRRGYHGRPEGGRILKQRGRRYRQVNLGRGNTRRVHQIVARSFLGEPRPGEQVCHGPRKNDDGTQCNWADNLEWGTAAKNLGDDKRRDGTLGMARGERNGQSKLTAADVREIQRLWQSTAHLSRVHPDRWNQYKLAEEFGLSQSGISEIVRGVRWQPS